MTDDFSIGLQHARWSSIRQRHQLTITAATIRGTACASNRRSKDRDFFRSQRRDKQWARDSAVRTFLHRFQFSGDQVFEPIGKLSLGERTKLILAAFMAINPDVLILDEPTNHLDLPTVELLEAALSPFI
jgi:ATPase subunit of ABC transporter with duplicated ATPase domains